MLSEIPRVRYLKPPNTKLSGVVSNLRLCSFPNSSYRGKEHPVSQTPYLRPPDVALSRSPSPLKPFRKTMPYVFQVMIRKSYPSLIRIQDDTALIGDINSTSAKKM